MTVTNIRGYGLICKEKRQTYSFTFIFSLSPSKEKNSEKKRGFLHFEDHKTNFEDHKTKFEYGNTMRFYSFYAIIFFYMDKKHVIRIDNCLLKSN